MIWIAVISLAKLRGILSAIQNLAPQFQEVVHLLREFLFGDVVNLGSESEYLHYHVNFFRLILDNSSKQLRHSNIQLLSPVLKHAPQYRLP